jgi:hypothetical protein
MQGSMIRALFGEQLYPVPDAETVTESVVDLRERIFRAMALVRTKAGTNPSSDPHYHCNPGGQSHEYFYVDTERRLNDAARFVLDQETMEQLMDHDAKARGQLPYTSYLDNILPSQSEIVDWDL